VDSTLSKKKTEINIKRTQNVPPSAVNETPLFHAAPSRLSWARITMLHKHRMFAHIVEIVQTTTCSSIIPFRFKYEVADWLRNYTSNSSLFLTVTREISNQPIPVTTDIENGGCSRLSRVKEKENLINYLPAVQYLYKRIGRILNGNFIINSVSNLGIELRYQRTM
jgi:hypothetical protein